jgi:hypothetical protein
MLAPHVVVPTEYVHNSELPFWDVVSLPNIEITISVLQYCILVAS